MNEPRSNDRYAKINSASHPSAPYLVTAVSSLPHQIAEPVPVGLGVVPGMVYAGTGAEVSTSKSPPFPFVFVEAHALEDADFFGGTHHRIVDRRLLNAYLDQAAWIQKEKDRPLGNQIAIETEIERGLIEKFGQSWSLYHSALIPDSFRLSRAPGDAIYGSRRTFHHEVISVDEDEIVVRFSGRGSKLDPNILTVMMRDATPSGLTEENIFHWSRVIPTAANRQRDARYYHITIDTSSYPHGARCELLLFERHTDTGGLHLSPVWLPFTAGIEPPAAPTLRSGRPGNTTTVAARVVAGKGGGPVEGYIMAAKVRGPRHKYIWSAPINPGAMEYKKVSEGERVVFNGVKDTTDPIKYYAIGPGGRTPGHYVSSSCWP